MLPPQNVEAEQAVLGAILLQDKALLKIVELLTPEDFYRDAHKTIFAAMLILFEKREPHDLITVTGLLNDQNKLENIGGASYLASLTDIIPFTGTLVHHAQIIRKKSVLRRLIQTTSEVAARCYDAQDDIEALVDQAEKTIFEIAHSNKGQGFQSMSIVVPRAFDRITKLFDRQEHITGVATGYDELDRMTAGLQPAEMIILAARPSMGKTALAMNIVQHAALIGKVAVAVFSLEMSTESLALRMLCSLGRIDSQRIRTGKLHDNDWPKLTRATGMLADAPIYIDDTRRTDCPGDARQGQAFEIRTRPRSDCRRLSSVDARQKQLREPSPGNLRHFTIAQSHGQGTECAGSGSFPAQPRPWKTAPTNGHSLPTYANQEPSNRMPTSSCSSTVTRSTIGPRTTQTGVWPK